MKHNSKLIQFFDFIYDDIKASKCRSYLLSLFDITINYCSQGIFGRKEYKSLLSYTNTLSTNNFMLHRLKLAIIDGREVTYEYRVSNTRRCGKIFILAMLYGRLEIVKYFLDNGFPRHINSRILNSQQFPSYALLALAIDNPKLTSMILKKAVNNKVNWFGLTPGLLMTIKNIQNTGKDILYICSSQYSIFCRINGYEFRACNNFPIFSIDFLAMKENLNEIILSLKNNSDSAKLSKCCFLVQSNLDVTLKLLEGHASVYQIVYGMTPLHFAAIRGSIECIIIFLDMGLSINSLDDKNRSPLFYAYLHKHYNLCNFLIDTGAKIDFFFYTQEESIAPSLTALKQAEALGKDKFEFVELNNTTNISINTIYLIKEKYSIKNSISKKILTTPESIIYVEHKQNIAHMLMHSYDKKIIKTTEEKLNRLKKETKKRTSIFSRSVFSPFFNSLEPIKTATEKIMHNAFPITKKMIPSDSFFLMRKRIVEEEMINIKKNN